MEVRALRTVLSAGSAGVITLLVFSIFREPRGIPPISGMILQEVIGFGVAFGAAFVMSRVERRSLGEYGLPAREIFGGKFWLGLLFGLAEISVLIGLIAAFGGYSFREFGAAGKRDLAMGIVSSGVVFLRGIVRGIFVSRIHAVHPGGRDWILACGDFAFRGVWRGTSGEPGEGWMGAAGVVVVGVFFCFTLGGQGISGMPWDCTRALTGGRHFYIRCRTAGSMMQGNLSHAVLHGPKWLTGGTVGPEGSVFCFVTMGLQFLVVMWLFPKKESEAVPQRHAVADRIVLI